MQVTIDQLFETIGRLHIDNIALNKMVEQQQADMSALKKKMEPRVDDEDRK